MLKSLSLVPFALFGTSVAQSGLTDLIGSQNDLSRLAQILGQVPNLAQSLAGLSNVTILAPVNSAFDSLLNSTQGANLSPDAIQALLAYHVINGTYVSANITETPTFVPTLLNQSFTVNNQAVTNVTQGQNLGLVLNEGKAVVVSGELKTSNVVQADIQQGGFTVHKIDRVLTLPVNLSQTGTALGLSAAVGALEATNLANTVDTVENLTIFAPNNEAFQAAGSAFANASQETLRSVLQYHAILGSVVFSPQITNTTVQTLQGNSLNLTVIDGTVFVNNAKVVVPNVILSNGVVHVIDSVLNPNGQTNPDDLDPDSTPTPGFPGASSVSGVPFTSAAPSATSTISVPNVVTGAPGAPTEGSGTTPTGAAAIASPDTVLKIGALFAGVYMVL